MSAVEPTVELAHFSRDIPFPLDTFQQDGCAAIADGKTVLVAAPTGAGKTIVGEFAVHMALATGKKAYYTTPIKALSNQKFAELADKYGRDRVGLLTGDNSINGEADIVVMTTEVLRNMLYAQSEALTNLGYVVMDEVHYLADRARGAVWEEVIIHLADEVQVVALSATISNAEEFGAWLAQVRGNAEVIVHEIRPIPLHQHMLVGNKILPLFAPKKNHQDGDHRRPKVNDDLVSALRGQPVSGGRHNDDDRYVPPHLRKQRRSWRKTSGGRTKYQAPKVASYPDMVIALDRADLLPGICFIFSRKGCERAVQMCRNANLRLNNTAEARTIRSMVHSRCTDLPATDLRVLDYEAWLNGLTRGFAAHHAGMLPTFKAIVEDLFEAGLVKLVFATETLALGINMPARSVVIDKLTKFNGDTHVELTAGEYTQLTGRAGRRGRDTVGHAVVLGRPGVDAKFVAGLASARTYPLTSSFKPSYNMAVNLVHSMGVAQAREVLQSSYAQFQADRAAVGLAQEISEEQAALAGYAEAMKCPQGDVAEYARLRREVSRGEREAKKLLGPDREAALQEVATLRRELKAHPVHGAKDREAHLRWEQRHYDLNRVVSKKLRQITRRTGSIVQLFDQVCRVLVDTGYLVGTGDELSVTEAGVALQRIYAETDLLIAECLRQEVWVNLEPSALAAVVSSLVYNGRGDEVPTVPAAANTPVRQAWANMSGVLTEIHHVERQRQMPTLPTPDPRSIPPILLWAQGASLEDVLVGEDVTAGDFVRLCRQTIDALGQIRAASNDPKLRRSTAAALTAIDRGVVNYTEGNG